MMPSAQVCPRIATTTPATPTRARVTAKAAVTGSATTLGSYGGSLQQQRKQRKHAQPLLSSSSRAGSRAGLGSTSTRVVRRASTATAAASAAGDIATSKNNDSGVDADGNRERRRILVFVEPSPFSHVSGMKNRFLRLIENLVDLGDDVVVVTPDRNAPETYHGAQVIGVQGILTGTFQLPFYPGNTLLLSYAKDRRVEELFQTNPPAGLYKINPVDPQVESARFCQQYD